MKKLVDEVNVPFFSHGKTNSCGVAIGFIENNKLEVVDKKKTEENGRILISENKVEEKKLVLVNFDNPNTETEQVANLHGLDNM